MRKKLLCSMLMLFSVFLFGGLFSSTAFAAAVTYENIAIGEEGNELKYTLTADAEASMYTATVCVPKTVRGEITIPATVDYKADDEAESHTYTVTTITKNSSGYSGDSNYGVTKITISEGITTIGDMAFQNFTALNSVTFPKTIATLGSDAFKFCSRLASVDLSATSLTSVPDNCFSYCKALSEVTLTTTVTSIDERAFYGCDSLLRVNLTDLDSLTNIGWGAFENCSRLRYSRLAGVAGSDYEFVLPASVASIGGTAFCLSGLVSVDLGACSSLVGLPSSAFEACFSMRAVLLPSSLEAPSYPGNPFADSLSLQDCSIVNDESAGFKVLDGVLFSKDGATLYCYPAGRPDAEFAVPAGVTEIARSAFSCSRLHSITLPAGLVRIYESAFSHCSLLKAVTLPSSVAFVDPGAFESCASLYSIDLSACSTLTAVSDCFHFCSALRSLRLPQQLPDLSVDSFTGCECVTLFLDSGTPLACLSARYNAPVIVTVVAPGVSEVPSIFANNMLLLYPDTANPAWDVSAQQNPSVLVPYHVENSEFTKVPLQISLDVDAIPLSVARYFVDCLYCIIDAGYEVVNGDEIREAGFPFIAYEDRPGGTTSDSLTKKVILTRTTYALKYDGDCVSNFTGETMTRPTPSEPEILTLDNVTDDNVTLKIYYGTNNPQDYRVRVHDEVLIADSDEDRVYTYTVQVNEPITRVYIECPYDVAGNGVFTNTGSGIYVYNRKWRV